MTVWFASDHHIGHVNISKPTYADRPFWTLTGYNEDGEPEYDVDIPAMNKTIIDNHNDLVADSDVVIFGGDLCMGKIADSLALAKTLRGDKYLLPGNHDRCWWNDRKAAKWIQAYRDAGFIIIGNTTFDRGTIDVSNFFEMGYGEVEMCHFPFIGDSHDEDRYADCRPVDKGQWLLHGHIHSPKRLAFPGTKMIHIGIDSSDLKPIHIDEIKELMV